MSATPRLDALERFRKYLEDNVPTGGDSDSRGAIIAAINTRVSEMYRRSLPNRGYRFNNWGGTRESSIMMTLGQILPEPIVSVTAYDLTHEGGSLHTYSDSPIDLKERLKGKSWQEMASSIGLTARLEEKCGRKFEADLGTRRWTELFAVLDAPFRDGRRDGDDQLGQAIGKAFGTKLPPSAAVTARNSMFYVMACSVAAAVLASALEGPDMVLLRARLDDLARWSVQSPIMCEIKDRPGHWLVICK